MSQTPVTVTYSLEEVLGQINQKLDTLQKDVADFRTETKVAMEGVKREVNGLKGDVNNCTFAYFLTTKIIFMYCDI